MDSKFCPRRAVEADISQIMTVIEDARRRLYLLGVDQWQNGYPDETAVREDIRRACGWVLADPESSLVAAYSAIIEGPDPYYSHIEDGEWLFPDEPYLVVHRTCVREGFCRRGLALQLVNMAYRMACDAGMNLRIDTHADNVGMQRLASAAGFVRCGTVYVRDGARTAYEKPAVK